MQWVSVSWQMVPHSGQIWTAIIALFPLIEMRLLALRKGGTLRFTAAGGCVMKWLDDDRSRDVGGIYQAAEVL